MTHTRNKRHLLTPLLFIAVFLSGCIFDGGGGGGSSESSPSVTSLSIKKDAVVTSADIEFSWTGNTLALEYQYVLDGEESAWIDTTAVSLTGLAEGAHVLTVRARKDTLIGKDSTVAFTVDAVTGPGVLFSPRKISDISYVTVYLEDVSSLMSAHIEIEALDTAAYFMAFEKSESFTGQGQMLVFHDESDQGRLVLDVGFPGAVTGAEGRIELGRFLVRSLTGEGYAVVDTLATQFRDINNERIALNGLDMIRIGR